MASKSQTASPPQTPEPTTWSPDNFPPGWGYIDGVERNKARPENFEIPSFAEKMDVVVGDFVKIGIENLNPKRKAKLNAERFWVEIKAIDGHLKAPYRFIGVVRSHLIGVLFDGIGFGDIVKFHSQHIIATSPKNKNFHKHTAETATKN